MEFEKLGREYVYDEAASEYVPVDKELSGAVFGIYAEEPVCSSSGAVLVEKDALIEIVTSNENGKLMGSAVPEAY